MATKAAEVPILGDGIDQSGPVQGTFALNMLMQQSGWEVRKGFGQVGQYSSSFGMPFNFGGSAADAAIEWGPRGHLGSYLITTNTKHEQIVSVWFSFVHTENMERGKTSAQIYTVTIDDLTTGDRWEEALYPHTAEREGGSSPDYYGNATDNPGMPFWHGNYETSAPVNTLAKLSRHSYDRQSWVSSVPMAARAVIKPFFFQEFRDNLFFGSEEAGIWIYSPTHFRRSRYESNRPKGVNGVYESEWIKPYSEGSMIMQCRFVSGLHVDAYQYYNHAFIEPPRALTRMGPYMVFASRRGVYISDKGYPCSVMLPNTFNVDSEHTITALAGLNNQLYIFTESETYLYRFPQGTGAITSGGTLTKISESIGCINQSSITNAEGALTWVDRNGVYATEGGMNISHLSQKVDNLFKDVMTNPLNSYYPATGATSATNVQPKTFSTLDPNNVHMCYSPHLQALLVGMPNSNQALCLTNQQWSLWTSESVVNYSGGSSIVRATQNLQRPWFVASKTGLYVVGSNDVQLMQDDSTNPGGAVDADNTCTSYYLTRYGRGGGIDRSVQDEDYRIPTGYWKDSGSPGAVKGHIYFEKPFRLQSGTNINFFGTIPDTSEYYAVPITVVPPDVSGGFDRLQIEINYDFNNWEPVATTLGPAYPSSQLSVMLPSERASLVPLTSTTRTAVGTITIDMDGTAAAVKINLIPMRRNKIMYLVMKRTDLTNSLASMEINIGAGPPTLTVGGLAYSLAGYTWQNWFLGTVDKRKDDSVAQPVDWAYTSGHIGMGEPDNVKSRGLYVRMLSHGPGDRSDHLVPDWLFGLFNTVASSDRKGWMSQTIDFTADPDAIDENSYRDTVKTIRTRVAVSADVLRNKVFGQAGVTWDGTYLIDDEEVSLMATSDSAKGKCVSYMMFGFIQNRAQALKLESAVAAIRPAGGRRRTGR